MCESSICKYEIEVSIDKEAIFGLENKWVNSCDKNNIFLPFLKVMDVKNFIDLLDNALAKNES